MTSVSCPCGMVEWDQEEIDHMTCKCCGIQRYDPIAAFPPHPSNASLKRRSDAAIKKIIAARKETHK